MSVTKNCSLFFFSFSIAAIKTTISSQVHACVRWLERGRILLMASWRQRPGLFSKSTISHWRRLKGPVWDERKTGTWWFLLMFKMTNVGTAQLLNPAPNSLCFTFTLNCHSRKTGLWLFFFFLVLSHLCFNCMCFIYLNLLCEL